MLILKSNVPGFEGDCRPTWLNRNQVCIRFDGGITGFFRRVRYVWGWLPWHVGPEFHGIIRDGAVHSTRTDGVEGLKR